MSNITPQTPNFTPVLDQSQTPHDKMLERRKKVMKVAAGVAAPVIALTGAAIWANQVSDNDAALKARADKVNERVIPVAELSDKNQSIEVKVNDTVGSIVEKNTKVTSIDIPGYVATDAVIDAVEEMPENTEALSDGILQIDETLVVPKSAEVSAKTER